MAISIFVIYAEGIVSIDLWVWLFESSSLLEISVYWKLELYK